MFLHLKIQEGSYKDLDFWPPVKNTEDQRQWVHILGAGHWEGMSGQALAPWVPPSPTPHAWTFLAPVGISAAPPALVLLLVSPLGVALVWWNQERAAVLWREGEACGAGMSPASDAAPVA